MVDIGVSSNNYRVMDPKSVSSFVVGLLGKRVATATAQDRDTLELLFEGGPSLRVTDDSTDYESFVITMKSGQSVVV